MLSHTDIFHMLEQGKSLSPALLVLASTLALGACSSSSDSDDDDTGVIDETADEIEDDGPVGVSDGVISTTSQLDDLTGDVQLFGFVSIEQFDEFNFNQALVDAFFFSSETPIAAVAAANALIPQLETCDITMSDPDVVDVDAIFGVDVDFVSAGENIVFTSPAGTFATLESEVIAGDIGYDLPDGVTLSLPIPAGLSVDIPGDTFLNFASVPVPDVEVLTGVSMSTDDFNIATVTTWDAGNDPDALIVLFASGVDFATSTSIQIVCATADDGAFTLPESTQAELGATFTATAEITRTAVSFLTTGNTLLTVTNESTMVEAPDFPPNN